MHAQLNSSIEYDSSGHLGILDSRVDDNRCSQDVVREESIMIKTRIFQVFTSREFSLLKGKEVIIYG